MQGGTIHRKVHIGAGETIYSVWSYNEVLLEMEFFLSWNLKAEGGGEAQGEKGSSRQNSMNMEQ